MKTKYVLITPAHNEEGNIERVINSVIAQTILPQKWLIVDDGSTDGTGEIIARYEDQHDFITSLELKREDVGSYYNRRTRVVLTGYEKIKKLEFDFLAILDADISFGPTYYEDILKEFEANPKLGSAGGKYVYKFGNRIQKVLIDDSCVPGSVQMFRRECYEQTGGYIALKHGGDDTLIEIMARMHDWETRSFSEHQVIQHRRVGTAERSVLLAKFRQGFTEYGIATHPLFMLAKSLRRVFLERPYILGSTARMAGFLYAYLRCEERKLPDDVVHFVRKEQIGRLWSCIRKNQR